MDNDNDKEPCFGCQMINPCSDCPLLVNDDEDNEDEEYDA